MCESPQFVAHQREQHFRGHWNAAVHLSRARSQSWRLLTKSVNFFEFDEPKTGKTTPLISYGRMHLEFCVSPFCKGSAMPRFLVFRVPALLLLVTLTATMTSPVAADDDDETLNEQLSELLDMYGFTGRIEDTLEERLGSES